MFWKTANLIRRPFLRSHIIAHRTSIIESVIMFILACYYYVILCLGQNACCDWLILRVVFFQVLSVCHSLEFKYFPPSGVRNVTKKQLFTFFCGSACKIHRVSIFVFVLLYIFSISLWSFEAHALNTGARKGSWNGTRDKRSAHACLPCFRRIFAIEIIRDNKTN